MSISANAQAIEQLGIVDAMGPVVPSAAAPVWISLKGFDRCCVLLVVKNGVTVTGSAIALQQATAVAGTGSKTLNFVTAYRKLNTGPGGTNDAWSSFAVASNTFTTDATNSQEHLYAIEVQETDLDVNNYFDCMRVTVGNGVATTIAAIYLLYPSKKGPPPSAIID
jgi:hypothetical protein